MPRPPAGSMARVRRANTAHVLRLLRASAQPQRIAGIAGGTGLSRPTVEALAESLTRQGWLLESEGVPQGGRRSPGRPARTYAFNAEAGWVLGIDVGAHKVTACRADLRGGPRAWGRRAVDPATPAAERLESAGQAVADAMRGAGGAAPVYAATLATPGVVAADGRGVAVAPALPGWEEADFTGWAAGVLPCPLRMENDANLAALAEHAIGTARGRGDVVLLLLGQRLGAGVTIGGRLLRGHHGAGGEVGYTRMSGGERPPAGFGALEARVNADAIAAMAEQELDRSGGTAALRGLREAAGDARLPALADAARAGDPAAERVLARLARRLAEGIAPMLLVLDPEMLVLGGGVSRMGDLLRAPLEAELADRLLFTPEVALSQTGDQGAVLGAVHHALQSFEETVLTTVTA
ncbi:ROK family transcriptional regulator [Nocardiopsis sp. CNT-189]|uniref:ROK family transcriptional regulator n=1 Tax=Nocardiopsis oceanisediminis TaxID=2816862 RepID=UPI003B3AC365